VRATSETPILLLPSDGAEQAPRFLKHRGQRRHTVKPSAIVIDAVRARSAVENGANELETAVDRRGRYAVGQSIGDEALKGPVMYPAELQCANVASEQANVPRGHIG
jgi:hypothetical protein